MEQQKSNKKEEEVKKSADNIPIQQPSVTGPVTPLDQLDIKNSKVTTANIPVSGLISYGDFISASDDWIYTCAFGSLLMIINRKTNNTHLQL